MFMIDSANYKLSDISYPAGTTYLMTLMMTSHGGCSVHTVACGPGSSSEP